MAKKIDPLRAAAGRSYGINLAGNRVALQGQQPIGVVFDGELLWVANAGSKNLLRIRPQDGAQTASYNLPGTPAGIVHDGLNLWVLVKAPVRLVKIHAADGHVIGTWPLTAPRATQDAMALAFDGVAVWVSWAGSAGGNLMKISASTGQVLSTTDLASSLPGPMVSDGTYVWAALPEGPMVMRVRAADGVVDGGAPAAWPTCLALDGQSLWVGSQGAQRMVPALTEIDPVTNAVKHQYLGPPDPFCDVWVTLFDGSALWLFGQKKVRRVDPATGAILQDATLGFDASAAAFDGVSVWAADRAGNALLKL